MLHMKSLNIYFFCVVKNMIHLDLSQSSEQSMLIKSNNPVLLYVPLIVPCVCDIYCNVFYHVLHWTV